MSDTPPALQACLGTVTERGTTGIDADLYIDAAGAPGIVNDVVRMARPRGRATLVVVAVPKGRDKLDVGAVLAREITIRGSLCYPDEFPEVIDMLADPRFDIEPMVSHRYAFAEFRRAFAVAEDQANLARTRGCCHCRLAGTPVWA